VSSSRRPAPRRQLAAALAAASLAASPAALAQAPASAEAWSPWELATYKTLTYEAMAQGSDLVAYFVILGGETAGSAGFFAVNAVTSAAAYYTHELIWQLAGPLPEPYAEWTLATKAATYRVVNTARAYGLGYLVAGDPLLAGGFALAGAVTDTGFYVLNDYVWSLVAPPPVAAPSR
jgi:uncharacterized membrane protein